MQPFYAQALLYGVALEVLANVVAVVAAAALVAAAEELSAAGAPGNEEIERWGSFWEVEYAGVIALVAASDGAIVVVAALAADKAADDASPRLGELDAVVAVDGAVAEPKVPAAVFVEIAHFVQVGVVGQRGVVRVQASYLARLWLTSLFRFPARYGLFAAAADYERQ